MFDISLDIAIIGVIFFFLANFIAYYVLIKKDWLKPVIFYYWFIKSSIFFPILGLIIYFFNKEKAGKMPYYWGKFNLLILEITFDLKVKYKLDKSYNDEFPKNCIIASEHQSTLEILALCAVIEQPVFVLKKSLLQLPIFGTFLKKIGMIGVDRKNYNSTWMHNAKTQLEQGKTLIIFPEGTRTPYGSNLPYKKGVFKLCEHLKQDYVPIAIDCGLFWPRKSMFKKPGITTISIGPKTQANAQTLREIYKSLL